LCAAGAGCYPHCACHCTDTLPLALKKNKNPKKIRKNPKNKKKERNCYQREKADLDVLLFVWLMPEMAKVICFFILSGL
jgi:hypothetical protein